MCINCDNILSALIASANCIAKKNKKGYEGSSSAQTSGPIALNNPLPGETRSPCIMKVCHINPMNCVINDCCVAV